MQSNLVLNGAENQSVNKKPLAEESFDMIVGRVELLCQNKPFGSGDSFGNHFLGRQHLYTYKLQLQGRKEPGSGFLTLSAQRQFSIVQTCNIDHKIEQFIPQCEVREKRDQNR